MYLCWLQHQNLADGLTKPELCVAIEKVSKQDDLTTLQQFLERIVFFRLMNREKKHPRGVYRNRESTTQFNKPFCFRTTNKIKNTTDSTL